MSKAAAFAALTVAAAAFTPLASGQKVASSCEVAPVAVAAGQTFTVTAAADVPFDFDLVSPSGVVYVWPSSTPGTVSYQISESDTGQWRVDVNELQLRSNHKKVVASCPFAVT